MQEAGEAIDIHSQATNGQRGHINFDVVARKMGTRTRGQCLDKWYRQLAPSMLEQGKPGCLLLLLLLLLACGMGQPCVQDWLPRLWTLAKSMTSSGPCLGSSWSWRLSHMWHAIDAQTQKGRLSRPAGTWPACSASMLPTFMQSKAGCRAVAQWG